MKKSLILQPNDLIDWLKPVSDNALALDTELFDRVWPNISIAGMSLCDGGRACYIDLYENKKYEEMCHIIKEWLDSFTGLLVMHNAPFDLAVLKTIFDVPESIEKRWEIFDTMTVAHLLDENIKKSLKFLASYILNRNRKGIPNNFDDAISKGWHNEQFYRYATEDAIETYLLYQWQAPQLNKFKLKNLWKLVEEPFHWCLRDLLLNGIAVNQSEILELQEKLREHIANLEIKMYKEGGIDYHIEPALFDESFSVKASVNLNSPAQLQNFITNKLGIELTERTKTGSFSTSADVLEKLYKETNNKFIGMLLEYRSATKMLNSFLKPLPDMAGEDGRIRVSFRNTVAVTGRVSASRLHQLPKDNTGPVPLRQCFVAPPGKKLIAADFKGQELRILAHVTKDKTMLKAFADGVDLHQTVADELGISRDKAKAVNFGLMYGKTAYGFAKDWDISEEKAQEFVDYYFAKFPAVREAIAKCHYLTRRQAAIRSLTGRIRRFESVDKPQLREAFNFLIQSVGADIMKRAAANVLMGDGFEKYGLKMILTVHDELVYEGNEETIEEACQYVRCEMERAGEQLGIIVPMLVDIGYGDNYQEAKNNVK